MEYIINPWWFFLINWLSRMDFFLVLFTAVSFFGSFVFFVDSLDDPPSKDNLKKDAMKVREDGELPSEDNLKKDTKEARESKDRNRRRARKCFVAGMVSLLCWTFIPSETTMYKMMIAGTLTKENVQDMHEFIAKDLNAMMDKITESAVKIKEAEQNEK